MGFGGKVQNADASVVGQIMLTLKNQLSAVCAPEFRPAEHMQHYVRCLLSLIIIEM